MVGDTLDLSQSTVSRCVRRVSTALSSLVMRFVQFPTGEDAVRAKTRFRAISGFPNVLGCVDGTYINIKKPKDNENEYVNRKGRHSLNVQMICDYRFKVTSLTAKWPGSTHDSRIWRECSLSQQFESGAHNGFLLGDSGYPCKSYLMTPFLNPETQTQENFNTSLCRTRVLIEQTYGILKKRFPILHFSVRSEPGMAVKHISSCVALHNIGIIQGDIVDTELDIMVINLDGFHDIDVDQNDQGTAIRQQIANHFFAA